jgi:hypothetical protein|tara:strand:+ start:2717 stop:2911 length:195 start_codon:yes stop_codon:yes gene_type:complete
MLGIVYFTICGLIFLVLLVNSFTNNIAGRAFGVTNQIIPIINIAIMTLLLVCVFTMLYMISKKD